MDYNQNGNYIAFAGLAVLLLSKLGVSTDTATVMTVIGGIMSFVGIVKQYISHKKLAVTAGAIPRD